MPTEYWMKTIHDLDETLLQDLLTEVYTNKGWEVKNMHRIDPRSENGADLIVRKGIDKILITVKDKPRSNDVEQMKTLWKRKSEGKLIYVHSKPSTGVFSNEAENLGDEIIFLQGKSLHEFLIEGESLTYLQLIFANHPLILEYSGALSEIWNCRQVNIPEKLTRKDLLNIYSLKQAILKKRAAVSVFALKYDEYINSFTAIEPMKFPMILEDTLNNLNLVQIFAGASLYNTFKEVSMTTPYILAHLWNLVSQRTYWNEYTHFTNKLPNTEEVKKFTIYYWVLPSAKAIGEAKFLSGNAIGFLSGLKDILESLSRSLRDLEVAIDWVWSNTSIEF